MEVTLILPLPRAELLLSCWHCWHVNRSYLVGVARLEDVTGHLGLRVVGLAPQQIGKVGEIIAVVDEARDELGFVLEDEHGGAGAARRDAPDHGGAEDQLHVPRRHRGAAVALLALPADLRHQPRQHGQGGAPVQRGPADVAQGEALVRLRVAVLRLHVEPANFGRAQSLLVGNTFHAHIQNKSSRRGAITACAHPADPLQPFTSRTHFLQWK